MQTRPTPSPSRIRVVVADDSAFMRRLLADGLTERGSEVVGGRLRRRRGARASARSTGPTSLSLDLAMPGMDGIGVLQRAARPSARTSPWSSCRRSRRRTARARSTPSPRARSSSSPSPAGGDPPRGVLRRALRQGHLAAGIAPPGAGAAAPAAGRSAGARRAARPPRPRRRGMRVDGHRLLDRRPARARPSSSRRCPRRPRRRRHDRPAHAGRLHRLARRSGSTAAPR